MEITTALLCDAATVREGLLHVLGGGLTRLWRAELPAPLGVTLALSVALGEGEFDVPHEVQIDISNPAGYVARAMGGLQAPRPSNLEPGERLLAPVVQPLGIIPTGSYGAHVLAISLDAGAASAELQFWVLHPDEQALPPLA
jgi:hypothetical protein